MPTKQILVSTRDGLVANRGELQGVSRSGSTGGPFCPAGSRSLAKALLRRHRVKAVFVRLKRSAARKIDRRQQKRRHEMTPASSTPPNKPATHDGTAGLACVWGQHNNGAQLTLIAACRCKRNANAPIDQVGFWNKRRLSRNLPKLQRQQSCNGRWKFVWSGWWHRTTWSRLVQFTPGTLKPAKTDNSVMPVSETAIVHAEKLESQNKSRQSGWGE
jgi:hypothetical protein